MGTVSLDLALSECFPAAVKSAVLLAMTVNIA